LRDVRRNRGLFLAALVEKENGVKEQQSPAGFELDEFFTGRCPARND